jgi:hypothetical protein
MVLLQIAKAADAVWAEAEAWVEAEARAEEDAWQRMSKSSVSCMLWKYGTDYSFLTITANSVPLLIFPAGALSDDKFGAAIPFVPVGDSSPRLPLSEPLSTVAPQRGPPESPTQDYRTPTATPVKDDVAETTGEGTSANESSRVTAPPQAQTHLNVSAAVEEPAEEVDSSGGSMFTFDFQTSPSSSSAFRLAARTSLAPPPTIFISCARRSLHDKLSSPERRKLTPAEARQKLDDRQQAAWSNRTKSVSEIKEKVTD